MLQLRESAKPLLAASLVAILSASAGSALPGLAAAPVIAASADRVKVVLKDGRILEGEVLEESTSTVKLRVFSAGGLTYERELSRSEIVSIEKVGQTDPAPKADPAAPAPAGGSGGVTTERAATAAGDGASRIYLIEMTGKFGRDVSQTPLKRALADAKKHQPDYLIVKVDVDWKANEFQERAQDEGAFDELFKAEDLDPILTKDIQNDPEWVKKPTLVMWIRKAMGGAAFLPLISEHIYFTTDGRQGGIGGLENIFGTTGDEVVREKQFSLRLGHAEGMAIQGKHEPKLIKAMARTDYVLSVSFEGGKPVYLENTNGEIVLTDDGQEDRKDSDADIVAFRGNDCLTLDAKMAYRLNVSDGTADTIEELADLLGIGRNYALVDGKADKIWKQWSTGLEDAITNIRKFIRKSDETAVGGDYDERKKARGSKIRYLQDAVKLLRQYQEVLDPDGVTISRLNTQIDILQQEQRRDRR